jgi:hypothetical protein
MFGIAHLRQAANELKFSAGDARSRLTFAGREFDLALVHTAS